MSFPERFCKVVRFLRRFLGATPKDVLPGSHDIYQLTGWGRHEGAPFLPRLLERLREHGRFFDARGQNMLMKKRSDGPQPPSGRVPVAGIAGYALETRQLLA